MATATTATAAAAPPHITRQIMSVAPFQRSNNPQQSIRYRLSEEKERRSSSPPRSLCKLIAKAHTAVRTTDGRDKQ